MKKVFKILINASVYYVLVRILFSVFGVFIFGRLSMDYSGNLLFYFVWIGVPIIISILISIKLHKKYVEYTGILLLPVLLVSTLLMGKYNNDYWGYWYKRPAVFSEVKKASSIISITDIKKSPEREDFTIKYSKPSKELSGREDMYYGNLDRPLMVFEDKGDALNDWFDVANDSSNVINDVDLLSITNTVLNSNLLVGPQSDSDYDTYIKGAKEFKGKIIVFKTEDQASFYHLALQGGQVSNDHYPIYEFLINKNDKNTIVKNQLYFIDFAGIEGFEYAFIGAFIEFILLCICELLVVFLDAFKLLKKID